MNYNKIYYLLKERKLSQEKLASMIGMTRNGLNKALKAENLKIETLELIAKALNVPVSYLFDEDPTSADSGIHQVASGKEIKQNISFNEAEYKIKVLEAQIEGLRREIAAKDKIIELLGKQVPKN